MLEKVLRRSEGADSYLNTRPRVVQRKQPGGHSGRILICQDMHANLQGHIGPKVYGAPRPPPQLSERSVPSM